jgi:hypothetical protein
MRCCLWLAGLTIPLVFPSLGCDDPTLAGSTLDAGEIPEGPLEVYGLTLDDHASPRDVAYAALRLLKDEAAAYKEQDAEKRRQIFIQCCQLAARDQLYEGYQQLLKRDVMPVEITPGQAVQKLVMYWGPIVAHYLDSVDTDYDRATAQMFERALPNGTRAWVLYDVTGRDGRPATVRIDMFHTPGGWRITRIGFNARSAASLRSASVAPPTPPDQSSSAD